MYKINPQSNSLERLDERKFAEINVREREHLQEWIVKNPEVLDDLLIIQKEFDGFNDTAERLDLLALDRAGRLVIIENKLDDTGRDVVWQALKYTAYCSTLTTEQIVMIYQQYLEREGRQESALENILDFLDLEEDNLHLNGRDQRIILVANKFRKEVTSTVLWLLDRGVSVQCFRATPYSMGSDLFLQVEQIIPLPETADFVIDVAEKARVDKPKSKQRIEQEARLMEFWNGLKQRLDAADNPLLDNISAKPTYRIATLRGRARYGFCIGRKGYRVELYFPNDPDKVLIESLYAYRGEIDDRFTLGKIEWERLEGKKASRVKFEQTGFAITGLPDPWNSGHRAEIADWYAAAMEEFYRVVHPYLRKVQAG